MSESLKKEIEKLLVGVLNVSPGDWQLAMAEPAGSVSGEVDNPQQVARKIIDAFLKELPSEIVSQGKEAIGNLLQQFGYNEVKVFLIEAAVKVHNS